MLNMILEVTNFLENLIFVFEQVYSGEFTDIIN
jgi:hypothetical protein